MFTETLFKRFSSIKNIDEINYMNRLQREGLFSKQWIAREKLHGTNLEFIDDGITIIAARRESVLHDKIKFFNDSYKDILQKNILKFNSFYNIIRNLLKHDNFYIIYNGELIGNRITNKNIINYGNDHRWLIFSVGIYDLNTNKLILEHGLNNINAIIALLNFVKLETIPVYSQDTLQQLLLNLEPNNIISAFSSEKETIEGFVLTPAEYLEINDSRIALKWKTRKHLDKKHIEKIESLELSDHENDIVSILCSYITEHRIASVQAKYPELNFNRLLKQINSDIIQDICRNYPEDNEKINSIGKRKKQVFQKYNEQLIKYLENFFS